MNLLFNMFGNQMIKLLEDQLVAHAPEVQAELLAELQVLLKKGVDYVEAKLGVVKPAA